MKTVERGTLPLDKVYYMTEEDILAHKVTNTLMCYGKLISIQD